MINATESFTRIKESAEQIRNTDCQRFPEAASFGEWVRQGDVYFTLIENIPSSAKLIEKPSPQLAPGTTKGSRHILQSVSDVELYEPANKTVLQGPIMKVKKEVEVDHPEHGNWILPPGCYSINYQRARAEELKRLAD